MSDGGDNASAHTLDRVLQHARELGTVVYAVTLVAPDEHEANPGVLKTLAREKGGRAFAPRRVEDVIAAFEQIAHELRSGAEARCEAYFGDAEERADLRTFSLQRANGEWSGRSTMVSPRR